MRGVDCNNILIKTAHEKAIHTSDLKSLLQQTEWTIERDERSIASMLSGPSVCVAAWKSERLIGYARAISDGTLRAFVEDVIVDADERGNGLGHRLVSCLLQELKDVQEIKLSCVRDLIPFYGKLGFSPAGLVGMELRRYSVPVSTTTSGTD